MYSLYKFIYVLKSNIYIFIMQIWNKILYKKNIIQRNCSKNVIPLHVLTLTLGQNHRYYTCGLVYRQHRLQFYLSSIKIKKKTKKKKNPNWFCSLREFFISNADSRKKCNARFNLFNTKLRSFFFFLKAINYCYAGFKTKKMQVKCEIHCYAILQRHNSFEEAKNFSQFRELFTLDQLSEEFLGQSENFSNSILWLE